MPVFRKFPDFRNFVQFLKPGNPCDTCQHFWGWGGGKDTFLNQMLYEGLDILNLINRSCALTQTTSSSHLSVLFTQLPNDLLTPPTYSIDSMLCNLSMETSAVGVHNKVTMLHYSVELYIGVLSAFDIHEAVENDIVCLS